MTCQKIITTREHLITNMQQLGFEIIPSAANFIFATHPKFPAEQIAQALREKAIIVRYFNKPRIDQYLRITIGTDAETQVLCDALAEIVSTS
jgi:histidinol-phosphate aminotransferase